jgi:hypothetical protein
MVALFAPEVRGGDFQQRQSADREDDHPDGVHAPHPARLDPGS